MTIMMISFALLGLLIGCLSGMLGIGGGVLVIPCLTFLFGFTQKQAVGTSLGMLLPPIGIFAFLQYYRAGEVDLRAAFTMAFFFAIGAFLGSKAITTGKVPEHTLRTIFAVFMIYIGVSLLFKSDRLVWSVLTAVVVAFAGLVSFGILRLIGRKWEHRDWPTIRETFAKHAQTQRLHDYEI